MIRFLLLGYCVIVRIFRSGWRVLGIFYFCVSFYVCLYVYPYLSSYLFSISSIYPPS